MTGLSALALVMLLPAIAGAQMAPDSPMVQALRDGRASAALPGSPDARSAAQMIIKRTGSAGVITVEFVRIARFASQPRCGRVGYGLYQKSSNTFWGQLGGQMNICDDGAPPRRQCPGTPVLVAAEMPCADGSRPVDTPEIRAAIARAVAGGSLGMDQVRARPDARPGKDGHGR